MIRNLRWFYVGWLGIIAGAIVLQFYLAGYGVFSFNGLNGFGAHFIVGDLIGIASLIGIGFAFAARVPWRITYINAGLFGLMVIQFVLAHTGIAVVSALHVINGIFIFGLTFYLVRETAKLAGQNSAQPSGATVKT
jgi:uncharacterized protein DUF6220